jgi:dTDP-4-amino-4,6-dideoxygalactose transaminase
MTEESDAALAEQYRLQGVVRSGMDGMDVKVLGGKFNLTDVAARVGIGQLARLDEFTHQRRELAQEYFKQLESPEARALGLGLPVADFEQSNWHMFQVVLLEGEGLPRRAEVMEKMHAAGIGTGVHYPPIHLFTLYREAGWQEGDFPQAEHAGRNILTLPLFPTMTAGDVSRVVATLVITLQSFLPS